MGQRGDKPGDKGTVWGGETSFKGREGAGRRSCCSVAAAGTRPSHALPAAAPRTLSVPPEWPGDNSRHDPKASPERLETAPGSDPALSRPLAPGWARPRGFGDTAGVSVALSHRGSHRGCPQTLPILPRARGRAAPAPVPQQKPRGWRCRTEKGFAGQNCSGDEADTTTLLMLLHHFGAWGKKNNHFGGGTIKDSAGFRQTPSLRRGLRGESPRGTIPKPGSAPDSAAAPGWS